MGFEKVRLKSWRGREGEKNDPSIRIRTELMLNASVHYARVGGIERRKQKNKKDPLKPTEKN